MNYNSHSAGSSLCFGTSHILHGYGYIQYLKKELLIYLKYILGALYELTGATVGSSVMPRQPSSP